jgi:hypothetical protein
MCFWKAGSGVVCAVLAHKGQAKIVMKMRRIKRDMRSSVKDMRKGIPIEKVGRCIV